MNIALLKNPPLKISGYTVPHYGFISPQPHHVVAWTALQIHCWQAAYKSFINPFYLKSLNKRLEEWSQEKQLILADPHAFKRLLMWNEEIVGFCEAGIPRVLEKIVEKSFINPVVHGEIFRIYILPSHQGKGLGEKLFSQAQQWLIKHRKSPFRLWVFEQNKSAILFYEKMGGVLEKKGKIDLNGELYSVLSYYFPIGEEENLPLTA